MSHDDNYYIILKDSLHKLRSQIAAYREVFRIQHPHAVPMMQVLHELSEECIELVDSKDGGSEVSENPLSKREIEVLKQVSKGLLSKEVAFILGISTRTVEYHLKSIFTKVNAQSRTEAAIKAIKNGWLNN